MAGMLAPDGPAAAAVMLAGAAALSDGSATFSAEPGGGLPAMSQAPAAAAAFWAGFEAPLAFIASLALGAPLAAATKASLAQQHRVFLVAVFESELDVQATVGYWDSPGFVADGDEVAFICRCVNGLKRPRRSFDIMCNDVGFVSSNCAAHLFKYGIFSGLVFLTGFDFPLVAMAMFICYVFMVVAFWDSAARKAYDPLSGFFNSDDWEKASEVPWNKAEPDVFLQFDQLNPLDAAFGNNKGKGCQCELMLKMSWEKDALVPVPDRDYDGDLQDSDVMQLFFYFFEAAVGVSHNGTSQLRDDRSEPWEGEHPSNSRSLDLRGEGSEHFDVGQLLLRIVAVPAVLDCYVIYADWFADVAFGRAVFIVDWIADSVFKTGLTIGMPSYADWIADGSYADWIADGSYADWIADGFYADWIADEFVDSFIDGFSKEAGAF